MLHTTIEKLESKIQALQKDHEKELNSIRTSHRQELDRTKDEMLNQLAAAEAQSMYIDEDSIRTKYMTEIERIKVTVHVFHFVSLSSCELLK